MLFGFLFFFFKQKTAYEMRISDWSSDGCSSDLVGEEGFAVVAEHEAGLDRFIGRGLEPLLVVAARPVPVGEGLRRERDGLAREDAHHIAAGPGFAEIGRAHV